MRYVKTLCSQRKAECLLCLSLCDEHKRDSVFRIKLVVAVSYQDIERLQFSAHITLASVCIFNQASGEKCYDKARE